MTDAAVGRGRPETAGPEAAGPGSSRQGTARPGPAGPGTAGPGPAGPGTAGPGTASPVAQLPPVVAAEHRAAVAALRESYAALPAGTPVRLAKGTSNLFRFRDPAPRAPGHRRGKGPGTTAGLDASAFTTVLHVDPAARAAVVGGMTTYEDLADATLKHGLMPLVVPQLKTITLGGAVTGLGI